MIIRKLILLLLLITSVSYGQEMITNGGFSGAANWEVGTSWDVADNEAVYDSIATGSIGQLDGNMVFSIVPNRKYTIEFKVNATTILGSVATMIIRSTSNEVYVTIAGYSNTSHIFEFTTPADIGDGGLEFVAFTARPFTLDNVSLKLNAVIGDDPYYVDPAGDDLADGSIGTPWKTFRKALDVADAGDTVYFRDGVYYEERSVTLTNTGTSTDPICFFNYPNETPIFDGKNFVDNMPPNTQGDVYAYGIYMERKEFINFKGIEMRNILQANNDPDDYWVVTIGAMHAWLCANMTYENMVIHNIGKKAVYAVSGAYNSWDWDTAQTPWVEPFPYDTSTWLNCDVYDICDSISWVVEEGDTIDTGGNHGDAFKIENWQGTHYIFTNIRAWKYSDDGFDPNHVGYKTYNNCWVMATDKYAGFPAYEGNGFKQTAITYDQVYYDSLVDPTDTIFIKWIGCVAAFCTNGIYNNLNLSASDTIKVPNNAVLYNNTAYGNTNGMYEFSHPNLNDISTRFRNNITIGSTGSDCGKPADLFIRGYIDFEAWESNNNFEYVYDAGSCPRWEYDAAVNTDASNFVSALDSLTIDEMFTADRVDWAMPENPFKLTEGSNLIDAGIQIPESDNSRVTLSFYGASPDMGSSESNYGAATSVRPYSQGSRLFMIGDRIFK